MAESVQTPAADPTAFDGRHRNSGVAKSSRWVFVFSGGGYIREWAIEYRPPVRTGHKLGCPVSQKTETRSRELPYLNHSVLVELVAL